VDVVNALHQFFDAVDQGAGVDTDGSIFGHRLDDQGNSMSLRMIGAPFVGDGEVRGLDLVKVEDLLSIDLSWAR